MKLHRDVRLRRKNGQSLNLDQMIAHSAFS
jgi:hypothetical protein